MSTSNRTTHHGSSKSSVAETVVVSNFDSKSCVVDVTLEEESNNTFTRLIESEKLHGTSGGGGGGGMSDEEESDAPLDDYFSLHGDFMTTNSSSPSPQPHPDVILNQDLNQEEGEGEWSVVGSHVVFQHEEDPSGFDQTQKKMVKSSSTKSESSSSSGSIQTVVTTTSSQQQESVVKEEKAMVAEVNTAKTKGVRAEEAGVVNGTESTSAKRKSKKSKSISVGGLVNCDSVGAGGDDDHQLQGVSISKLKSVYSGESRTTGDIPRVKSPSSGTSSSGSGEARVFAKVCVASLRRSYQDLTNLTHPQPPPAADLLLRPTSGSSLVTNKKRRAGSGGDNTNKHEVIAPPRSKSSSCTPPIPLSVVWPPPFLQQSAFLHTHDDLVGFHQKSSFTKFDELAKKGGESVQSEQQQQQQQVIVEQQKICKSCSKEVFLVELIKAEKSSWHRNCFRCSQCNKQLGVDSYSSHEGRLYCKPHFKKLFQPKVVLDQEDAGTGGDNPAASQQSNLNEVIIRESQPTQLPPDVARASEKQGTGLEDIEVDVRSKFEMFENFKQRQEDEVKGAQEKPLAELASIKRSASVLKRLARYEGKEEVVGVANDELHGGGDNEEEEEAESSGDDLNNDIIRSEIRRKLKSPAAAMAEIMQCKQMDEVRAKWEEGKLNSKQEELTEHRKAELNKFRSRLCHGKSNQLKEMYENSVEESSSGGSGGGRNQELEELRLEKAKGLREMFEKGEVRRNEDEDEEDSGESGKQSLVQRDSAVFEGQFAKQSRSLFKELDQNLIKSGHLNLSPAATTTPTITTGKLNKQSLFLEQQGQTEVVRCVDKVELVPGVKTEELTSKFKFFETYEKQLEEGKRNEKKAFRITPPRDGPLSAEPQQMEVYRDPNVVRASDNSGGGTAAEDDLVIQKSKTTSKMLSKFRQLEQSQSASAVGNGPRPLKQFTPPREPARVLEPDSDEEYDQEEEEESEEEEEAAATTATADKAEEDAFLKEVGSLARARSLRARFERWETEENKKNKAATEETQATFATANAAVLLVGDESDSIESARNLRAKFEQIQQAQLLSNNNNNNKQLKVRRFVELQIQQQTATSTTSTNSNEMSEECAFCDKKVYAMEKLEANSKVYHKNCFRCSVCKAIMRMDSFTFHHGALYCKNHFKQLFKIKGNYDEGFGHETQKQIFARKQQEKENQ